MTRLLRRLTLVLLLLLATAVQAMAPIVFQSDAEEARFRALTAELRCVMCQNQSLADSNAQIAVDLRKQVLNLMRKGQSDAQIKAWLVERYSDFVLYRPEVKPMTWLLWFGPGVIVLGGAITVIVIVRRRAALASPLSAGEHKQPKEPEQEQEW